jgi:uncharacterized membrane protein YagU involved in acid resistance
MNSSFSKIIRAGLLVGTIDILSAFGWYFIKTGKTRFLDIFKFIASGIFGKQAFAGGTAMILTGLFLHYFIAFAFTIFFFLVFKKIRPLSKHKILTAVVYGLFIWSVMNLIVVPLSAVASRPFSFSNALINILILIIGIGLPLSFIASAYYKNQVS